MKSMLKGFKLYSVSLPEDTPRFYLFNSGTAILAFLLLQGTEDICKECVLKEYRLVKDVQTSVKRLNKNSFELTKGYGGARLVEIVEETPYIGKNLLARNSDGSINYLKTKEMLQQRKRNIDTGKEDGEVVKILTIGFHALDSEESIELVNTYRVNWDLALLKLLKGSSTGMKYPDIKQSFLKKPIELRVEGLIV